MRSISPLVIQCSPPVQPRPHPQQQWHSRTWMRFGLPFGPSHLIVEKGMGLLPQNCSAFCIWRRWREGRRDEGQRRLEEEGKRQEEERVMRGGVWMDLCPSRNWRGKQNKTKLGSLCCFFPIPLSSTCSFKQNKTSGLVPLGSFSPSISVAPVPLCRCAHTYPKEAHMCTGVLTGS